ARPDDVPQVRDPALRPAEHLDAHHFLGPGVVGHVEVRVHLDHDCARPLKPTRRDGWAWGYFFSWVPVAAVAGTPPATAPSRLDRVRLGGLVTIRTSCHRFSVESGRDSMISTVSRVCA